MGVIFKNNVMYGAGDIEISSVCYSEEEQEIGCWTDGKPLYKHTLAYKKSDISSGNNTITHGISNIGISVWLEGLVIYIDGNCVTLPAVGANNDWSARAYDFGTTTFVLTIGSGIYNNLKTSEDAIFITVYYTKTTDTPGSGIWTPSGVPAVHYSTDEQVVGTWIDGSTIYEKTFEFSSQLALSANNWTNSSATVTGISNILDIIGYDGTAAFRLLGARPSNDTIQLFATVIIGISKITIRYTKTTS